MELVRRIKIFYCMREGTHSMKRSSLSTIMVVGILGIEELSPWTSFVHHMLVAWTEDWRHIINFM
jgi:hypothetical protein